MIMFDMDIIRLCQYIVNKSLKMRGILCYMGRIKRAFSLLAGCGIMMLHETRRGKRYAELDAAAA